MQNDLKKLSNFKKKNIVELVEFIIEEKESGLEFFSNIFFEYFNQMDAEKLVPFLFADYYFEVFFKKNKVGLHEVFDEMDIREQGPFLREGFLYFFVELLKFGYFYAGRANDILHTLFSNFGWGNERLQDSVAQFLKDKDEIVQLILIDSMIDAIPPDEISRFSLMKIYKNGNDYVKFIILNFLNSDSNIHIGSTEAMQDILDVIADDIEGNDDAISYLILLLIDGWFMSLHKSQRELLTNFLLDEKGIKLTDSMLNRAFDKKVKILLEKIEDLKNQYSN